MAFPSFTITLSTHLPEKTSHERTRAASENQIRQFMRLIDHDNEYRTHGLQRLCSYCHRRHKDPGIGCRNRKIRRPRNFSLFPGLQEFLLGRFVGTSLIRRRGAFPRIERARLVSDAFVPAAVLRKAVARPPSRAGVPPPLRLGPDGHGEGGEHVVDEVDGDELRMGTYTEGMRRRS